MITVRSASPVVEADEFACLNLNIAVPLEALPKAGQETAKSLLPVKVFVHGYVVYHFYLFYRIHYLMFIKRSFHE